MTDEPLTPARFRALAEAYGAEIGRWPRPLQAAATRMAEGAEARAALRDAGWLDGRLDGWSVAPPDAALAARIVAAVPPPRVRVARRVRLWWSGLGFAALLAGAATGSAMAAVAGGPATAADDGTAFGTIGPGDAP